MKFTFVGTGSAFTTGGNNYQSNMVLENDFSNRLLIDCGSDARFSLYDIGLSYDDIDDVFISHLHSDHVGGLEWLALMRKFYSNKPAKPCLHLGKDLESDLWDKVLSGGLTTLMECEAELSSFFNIDRATDGTFLWCDVLFTLVPAIHAYSNHRLLPCYGLFFCVNGHSVYITSDTQFFPERLQEFYRKASIIFHDCETAPQKSGLHSPYDDLKSLDSSIKSKMWLYHYSPGPLPDAEKDGFRGFVKKGQCFDFSN